MPATLRQIRGLLGSKLGGFQRDTVSIDPDISDSLAQRQILCGKLYDADRGSRGYAGHFAWAGRHGDQRRVRENGYRTLAYAAFTPPTSGTYILTFYGFGATSALAFNADAATVQTAIHAANPGGLGAATVTATGSSFIVALPDVIDMEISSGTAITSGGVGALEVNAGFTAALRVGDEFELSSRLPFNDADNIQGLNTLINMALRNMWYIGEVPITPITNYLGVQSYLNLSGTDWLSSDKQIIALFNPTLWQLSTFFVPPGSGSYTLSLTSASTVYTTSSLAFNASGATILAALRALNVPNVTFSVTPTTVNASYTIVMDNTYFAEPLFSVSNGTVTNTVTMLQAPSRSSNEWKFQYNGETPFLDNLFGQEGYSFMLKGYIPGYARVCPQASYGVLGTAWAMSTTGLVNDYDQVIPNADDVAAFAYALACDQLIKIDPTNTYWQRESKSAHTVAAGIKMYDLPYDDKPRGNYAGSLSGGWGSKGYWGGIS